MNPGLVPTGDFDAVVLLILASGSCMRYLHGQSALRSYELFSYKEPSVFNPWHDLVPGKEFPYEFDCLVEIPQGSRVKYELDKSTGLIRVDRILHSANYYPVNYGFVPRTYCEDGDPLDIFIFCEEPLLPNTIATVRSIGVIEMIDGGESDDKIVAILSKDPLYKDYRHIEDLPVHLVRRLTRFLEDYKILENKKVEVKEIHGSPIAEKILTQAAELYQANIKKLNPKA